MSKILIDSERFTLTMAQLAQGVININEGVTTIEPGSRIHRAMTLLTSMGAANKLHADTCLVDTETGEVTDGPYYCENGRSLIVGWRVCRTATPDDPNWPGCSIIAQGVSEAEARAMVTALNAAYADDPGIALRERLESR